MEAWWLHILQQRSPEQKEMLELIESSNGWIQRLQRERWAYEERLAAADGQIRALEEALDAEEKSKEALMLHLGRLNPITKSTEAPPCALAPASPWQYRGKTRQERHIAELEFREQHEAGNFGERVAG
eukprot:s899_g13.t1